MAEIFAAPFARGVRLAVTDALKGSHVVIMGLVRENLTGRILNRRTGRGLANVEQTSRLTRDGFSIGTTLSYLIAHEKGSARKAYFVAPVKTTALSWVTAEGTRAFSKGHWIPAWRFPRRPWLSDALQRSRPGVLRALENSLGTRLREQFRGGRLTVRIAELNRAGGALARIP